MTKTYKIKHNFNNENLNFQKLNGLIPAVIQNGQNGQVLMLGFMNPEALEKTLQTGRVTFFSRTKNRLWVKGETSGNFLEVKNIYLDCDQDTLLIQVVPQGPVCHTGSQTCFDKQQLTFSKPDFLNQLQDIIKERLESNNADSYVSSLVAKGINKIAQKVGEEAVEVVIEAIAGNKDLLLEESADLLFHFLILLQSQGLSLDQVKLVLQNRHK